MCGILKHFRTGVSPVCALKTPTYSHMLAHTRLAHSILVFDVVGPPRRRRAISQRCTANGLLSKRYVCMRLCLRTQRGECYCMHVCVCVVIAGPEMDVLHITTPHIQTHTHTPLHSRACTRMHFGIPEASSVHRRKSLGPARECVSVCEWSALANGMKMEMQKWRAHCENNLRECQHSVGLSISLPLSLPHSLAIYAMINGMFL